MKTYLSITAAIALLATGCQSSFVSKDGKRISYEEKMAEIEQSHAENRAKLSAAIANYNCTPSPIDEWPEDPKEPMCFIHQDYGFDDSRLTQEIRRRSIEDCQSMIEGYARALGYWAECTQKTAKELAQKLLDEESRKYRACETSKSSFCQIRIAFSSPKGFRESNSGSYNKCSSLDLSFGASIDSCYFDVPEISNCQETSPEKIRNYCSTKLKSFEGDLTQWVKQVGEQAIAIGKKRVKGLVEKAQRDINRY